MLKSPPLQLLLELPLTEKYLPVAQSFVEQASLAVGLARKETLALTLACEEIFMGLRELTPSARWELTDGGYFVELVVEFSGREVELHKLNLTAGIDSTQEKEVEQLGWFLAARAIDRFQIEHRGNRTRFRLRKNRRYPDGEKDTSPVVDGPVAAVREPDVQEMILFARRVLANEDTRVLPNFLRKPELMVAMSESDMLRALVAFSDTGQILGGGVWMRQEGPIAVLHGPYLFVNHEGLGQDIFHHLLNTLVKSDLVGVVTEAPVIPLPDTELEKLGRRSLRLGTGETIELHAAYRHLEEDDGFSVWSSDWLAGFLKEEYDRLALPRDQHIWQKVSAGREHSVLSCDFHHDVGEVTLRPVLSGEDADSNLKEHLELLSQESVQNIFFELDLGQSWHLSFSEALRKNDFHPCFIVPNAGRGDHLLLQKGVRS